MAQASSKRIPEGGDSSHQIEELLEFTQLIQGEVRVVLEALSQLLLFVYITSTGHLQL